MSHDVARRPSILVAVGIALAVAGCVKPDYGRCSIRCGESGGCPGGYSCSAADGFCHEAGAETESCTPPIDAGIDAADAMPLPTEIDILFVVDNSNSMTEEQQALTTGFAQFANALDAAVGERPSLHLGVISTDVGAGAGGIQGCSGNGDDGTLQNAPRIAGCTPPTDPFIRDVPSGAGRDINYPAGQIAETFGCIATLGNQGCGFEQTLESLRRALDGTNPDNAGFRRPDASLAVILLTDEDDCSASDPFLFDITQESPTSELGPLSSFRCFEFGVVCEPDSRTVLGPREDCVPRDDSPYMHDVADFIAFLRTLAPPERLTVVAITGPSTPVAVGRNDADNPELVPSCSLASGDAAPAVRIAALVGAFESRGIVRDICTDDDYGPIMQEIGALIAATIAD